MILLENRRARFEYEILDTLTAGMVLEGWEVKSLRAKQGNMKASWVKVTENELFLESLKIPRWPFSKEEQDKNRQKKLLLHKKEIDRLIRKTQEKGLTIIPLKIIAEGRCLKCEIGLGKGRKKYEKKQVLKERSMQKEARQTFKAFNS